MNRTMKNIREPHNEDHKNDIDPKTLKWMAYKTMNLQPANLRMTT